MSPIFFIAILISILQLTAVTYTRVGPFSFDLQIIALVFFSLRHGFKVGVTLGLFFGIFKGLFSISSFWSNIFLYTAIGSIIGYIGRWFYKESLPTFLLMLFCSLFFIYFLNYPAYFFKLFLPTAAYTIAVSIFLFCFLRELKA